jgi:hypothetical protein
LPTNRQPFAAYSFSRRQRNHSDIRTAFGATLPADLRRRRIRPSPNNQKSRRHSACSTGCHCKKPQLTPHMNSESTTVPYRNKTVQLLFTNGTRRINRFREHFFISALSAPYQHLNILGTLFALQPDVTVRSVSI